MTPTANHSGSCGYVTSILAATLPTGRVPSKITILPCKTSNYYCTEHHNNAHFTISLALHKITTEYAYTAVSKLGAEATGLRAWSSRRDGGGGWHGGHYS
ncbi:unnamed protein product [Meganyctiphanes norvegica]|uniref:Uncharacterized protein n=1 Tax=Meganyctiphanes norvegica TaxID=48144 RepID=A0AAV2R741_MEGNR